MITLKDMLLENRNKVDKGCLMAMLPKEASHMIVDFGRQLISDDDLYFEDGEEYGRELESHVTIRYGFTKDLNELDIRQILQNQKPFFIELIALDKFENDKFDVVIFKVHSEDLNRLNAITDVFPNENDFPDYKPHLTIAYVKKGKFPFYKTGFKLLVPITTVCYSPISGGKSYFNLKENIHETIESIEQIRSHIARLEKEWDRLDSIGGGTIRQREISKELNNLRNKLPKPKTTSIDYDSEKGQALWNQLRTVVNESIDH